jgi:hypothetical protein
MVDACVIRRVTGETTGPGGVITPTYLTIYTGKCRVQQPTALARPHQPGEAFILMVRLDVQLPMTVTGLQAEDQVLITSSALDADLAGRLFVVWDLAHKTHATARRVGVMERTS